MCIDRFLFMVIKLVELVGMGMNYQPEGLLLTLCRTTLPRLAEGVVAAFAKLRAARQ